MPDINIIGTIKGTFKKLIGEKRIALESVFEQKIEKNAGDVNKMSPKSPPFKKTANLADHLFNGKVTTDRESFVEEQDLIKNFVGRDVSELVVGLGILGDFSFDDKDLDISLSNLGKH